MWCESFKEWKKEHSKQRYRPVQRCRGGTIPKKKKSKKAKWLSEEALQIAEEQREAKSKGERERYIQLNAEFQK